MAKIIRQGATHKVVLGPAVAVGDGFTPVTTLALSSADEAEAILHDNGTVVDISGYTWAAIATADGYYHLTLQSGISGTVGHLTIVVNDDSLCLPLREDFIVVEEAVYDALYAASALGYVANAPVNVAQISEDSTAADNLEAAFDQTVGPHKPFGILDRGTLQSASATGATIRAAASFGDGILAGATIVITAGTGVGQRRIISDNTGDVLVVPAWDVEPDNTSDYDIFGSAPGASLSDIAGAIRTELTEELAAILDIETLVVAMDVVLGDVDDQTSQLKFNATDEVQIDLLRINNTVVLGDGDATPWGP